MTCPGLVLTAGAWAMVFVLVSETKYCVRLRVPPVSAGSLKLAGEPRESQRCKGFESQRQQQE